jgi:hypothetical protein
MEIFLIIGSFFSENIKEKKIDSREKRFIRKGIRREIRESKKKDLLK